ncbi:GmrSD restriction endonuclease domain-containing protein [Micromonospora echinospora]|uniref:GmrSD restriction endonuclease domain-containing protein n=1 Tax=Micromonospora echinospora TaxID=1877 RepID=UPI003A84426B
MTGPVASELSVRSESVQRVYGLYRKDRFEVNRRYQRKLVWGVEEKQRLIDSIIKDMPIPLFLVAEIGKPGDISYELIDGMQRFNAIFSFLENEFPVNGSYFDLDALADTKALKDEGKLVQRVPVMGREASVELSNYTVALSIFRPASSASVDEVFRRINSGGKRLSRQELRQAGTVSPLADLVRIVSSRIRTDTSPSDNVPLRIMPKLSITNRELSYGVSVDDIFWVKEGVLRREDVRESLDEQVVLDILIDCLVDPFPNTGTRIRDAYYDFTDSGQPDDLPTKESLSIASAISAYGPERLENHAMEAYDGIRDILATQEKRFSSLIEAGSGGRSPRYFHAVFLAVFELLFKDRMRIKDYELAARKLRGIGQGALSVPAGGGDWAREAKRSSVDAVKGVLRPAFEESGSTEDYSKYGWASQFETLLGNAVVEQQLFDCKQGFYTLGATRSFDEESFRKICRTLTAMANSGPGAVGHVVIGVADKPEHAARIEMLDRVPAQPYRHFQVVGIEREAVLAGKSLNDYWTWLTQRLTSGPLESALAKTVVANARLFNYRSRSVIVLKVVGGAQPVFFEQRLVERLGSETVDVSQADYMRIYSRFTSSASSTSR